MVPKKTIRSSLPGVLRGYLLIGWNSDAKHLYLFWWILYFCATALRVRYEQVQVLNGHTTQSPYLHISSMPKIAASPVLATWGW